MASNERVGITLDVLPGTFAGVTAALGGFNELVAATSQFSTAIANSTSVIDAMTLTLGVGLAGAAWESAKAFGELERGMKIVQAVSGQTSSQISILTQKASEFSVKYKLGIDDITAGLQTLGRAGLSNVNTQLDTMQAGLQAAKIQGMELNDALEKIVATTALLGGDLKSANFGQQAEKLTSQLLSTAMTAPIDMNDVVQTLSYSGGTAAAAGINIQNDDALYDYLGAISAFAQKGVKGSMAGTAMRAFFTKPASQDTSVIEAFNQLKMKPSDLWEDGGNAMRPVSEQIEIIHRQMEKLNMSTLDQIELWGKIVGPKMGQQMMKLNADTIKQTSREIRQTASATELANMTMDNFLSSLSTLEQNAQRSWRGYGEAALAWIQPIIDIINGLYGTLGSFNIGGIPVVQQFVKLGIIVIISQVIQKLGAVRDLFKGIIQEIRNMWGAMSRTERTTEEQMAAEQKRLQALGLTENQAKTLADTENTVTKNIGASNKVLAEFLVKLNEAVALMSELATLSRAQSMNMISGISSAQHNRLYNKGAKDMSKTAWFNQHQGNVGHLTKNEFASLSLRHGMSESDLLKIYDSSKFRGYAQSKQGSSYAFPTAVSLEKYLQENRKGLYDPKVNPIMGIVNNIKTDTGVIAQGIKTGSSNNKTSKPLIESDNKEASNKKQSKKSSKSRKEKAEEKQAIEEEKQAKENKVQTNAEEKVTKALQKQEQAAQTCADLMNKEAQQRREAVNKSNASRSQIARENADQRIAQLKDEEVNGATKVITQQTIRLNEQIVESNQHKKMHQMALNNEKTIGNALTQRYIIEEDINNIEQQYLALLTNNVRTIKGKSPGYTGQFTIKNIERRKTPYIYGNNQNADAEALASNQQAITRYSGYQDNVQQGQLQQTMQRHLNTERKVLEEVEEELAILKEEVSQESSNISLLQKELAERQEFISLYEQSKRKAREFLAKQELEWSKMYTGSDTNSQRTANKNRSIRDVYTQSVLASDKLIESIAKEEAQVRQRNLSIEHRIKYLETEKAALLENINFLEQNEANVQKEIITQEEFLQKETMQKKTAHITTLESILNKLIAENDALEQEKNKIFAYSQSKQNMIDKANIGTSTHTAQNALLMDINAEYDSFLNKTRSIDNKINANKEQMNLVLGAIVRKLNSLGASIPASLMPNYAHSNPNIKTSIVPGVGQTMPWSITNKGFWQNPVQTPLLLPAGPTSTSSTPNWTYGNPLMSGLKPSLLLPEIAKSLQFQVASKYRTEIPYATSNYLGEYGAKGMAIGRSYGGTDNAYLNMQALNQSIGVAKNNVLMLEQTAKTFQTSLDTAYAVTNKYSANIDAMSNISGAGGFLQSAVKTMNNYKTFSAKDLSIAYQILAVRDEMLAQERSLLEAQMQQKLPAKEIAETEKRIAQLEQERRVALEQAVVYARSALTPMDSKTGKRQSMPSTQYYEGYSRYSMPLTGSYAPGMSQQTKWQSITNSLSSKISTVTSKFSPLTNAVSAASNKISQLLAKPSTNQTNPRYYGNNANLGFWASARTNFMSGFKQSGRYIEGGGLKYNWLSMGMTGMVNWKEIAKTNANLSTLGKVSNVAGGALGSLGMMLGPFEVGMMAISFAMQAIQAAQQKYKEELEKINSKLSEARENFEKAEEAFLGAYEEQNPDATQDQKDEALLNLYANGPGDRDDELDSYRSQVYATLSQIEVNTRKKAEKENDWLWGSRGMMQKHIWSPWDETWGWVFSNRKNPVRDEWDEQVRTARETAAVNNQDENAVYGITAEGYNNSTAMETFYKDAFHLEEIDKSLNHYENWVDDLEDYSEQAKYATSIMSQGVDATGPTHDSSWLRTFSDYNEEQIKKGIWGSKNGINDYRKFEESLLKVPETVKTQIANSINQDPEFYKSMQRQMFMFTNGRLQGKGLDRENKILNAISRRVGNISEEQARQTLILSAISSINEFVQNQVQPAVLANVDAAMQGTQILGLTNTSVGYTGSSTAAVHQYVMVITSQLGQIVKQKALENASLMAESAGVKFEDLTKLAKEGSGAQGLSKTYNQEDADQAKQIFESMGKALYQGPMMTKGMDQEAAYKYAEDKFKELNTAGSSLPDMLKTWDKWFGFTMTPYIEEKWVESLQDTTGNASGPTPDKDKDKDKTKDKDTTANRKNWVNLAICNKKEIPKLNVNLFKKPPNFTILNRNFKLRDVNVNTADDAKSIQNAVKNSIIEIQNRSNPKIIQDDAAEYDPINATDGNTLPTGTKKTE